MNSSSARKLRQLSQFEQVRLGAEVIRHEADALRRLAERMPAGFRDAVESMLACEGSVLVSGIGKAGWVGQKLSATLASTGTRSHFLHPAEAIHGDLGRIGPHDRLLMFSNSGESEEVTRLLPAIERMKIPLIAITSRESSTLARAATIAVSYGPVDEACPWGLAPTTSTAVMLALGDALALAVAQSRGFGAVDFGQYHPGGSLGRKLKSVDEIMRPRSACRLAVETETVRSTYMRLAGPTRRSGAILVTEPSGRLTGIFTDSDLARLLERKRDADFEMPIGAVMTRGPAAVRSGCRVMEAIEILAERNLSELPVVDEQDRPVGMIDVTDVISLLPR